MDITQLKNDLPEQAKDIKLNLSNIFTEDGSQDLTLRQIYGVALACAYAIQKPALVEAILSGGNEYLSEADINAAKSAAMIMGMNNVYYRFVHLVSDKSYGSMPAKLRMNVIGNPGIPKVDFELFCLAVSAINGCGMCMDAHVKELIKAGVTQQGVQSAVRIASVLNAVGVAMSI